MIPRTYLGPKQDNSKERDFVLEVYHKADLSNRDIQRFDSYLREKISIPLLKIFKAQVGRHLDEGDVKAGKKSKRESTGLGVRSQDILVKSTDCGIR